MKHANLDFPIGKVNPSGIGTTLYRIRKRYITGWPTIEDDPDKNDTIEESDLAGYAGSFTLLSGKYWQKIYSTQGKGSISSETTGETDSKMFINHASFSFPDLTPEALGFSKASTTTTCISSNPQAGTTSSDRLTTGAPRPWLPTPATPPAAQRAWSSPWTAPT